MVQYLYLVQLFVSIAYGIVLVELFVLFSRGTTTDSVVGLSTPTSSITIMHTIDCVIIYNLYAKM
jgi:hypothetical protein